MNTKPIFSIIIPAYNIGNLVKEAIDSCLHQEGIRPDEMEIIIIDDGSTDDTFSYILSYSTCPNVKVIKQKNGGLSNARNHGMNAASGDYILFLDGDDWLASNTLSVLKRIAKPDEIIEFPLIYWFDGNNHEPKGCGIKPGVYSSKDFLHLTLGRSLFHVIPAPKRLYPTKLLKERRLRFLEGIYHEDNPFFIDVMMSVGHIRYIDKPLYYYRQKREGSITAQRTIRNFNGVIIGKDYTLKKYGFCNPDVVHLLSNMCVFQLIGDFSDDSHRKTIMKYFRTPHQKWELVRMFFTSRWRIKSQIRLFLLILDPYILWKTIKLLQPV